MMNKKLTFKIWCTLLLTVLLAAISPPASLCKASDYHGLKASSRSAIFPFQLICELWTDPLGIDIKEPGFGYKLLAINKNDRGLFQSAYQIIVSSTADFKQPDNGYQWNSGKVNSKQTGFIKYKGKAFQSSHKYWWRVRVWDQAGKCSAWSDKATFTMGLLDEKDWKAKWITAARAERFSLTPYGFRTAASDVDTVNQWFQLDLGKATIISCISLSPMFYADRAGWGFPLKFKVQVADDPDFKNAVTVSDHTSEDFENPKFKPVLIGINNLTCRYVRITACKFRNDYFALRQIQVISGGRNIASGKKVEALSSDESGGWAKQNLTDMPEDYAILPNYNSILFRKEIEVKPALIRAVVHVSGLSQYQLYLNGKKTGDYLLTPGWTNYKKTVLYNTYDVTGQLQAGDNALGIMLGNSMYNIQPDTIKYVKFLNSFGPAKEGLLFLLLIISNKFSHSTKDILLNFL